MSTISEFAARLTQPSDPSLKLGGEFTFLGTADEGTPEFEATPPSGVVKVYHNTKDHSGKKWTNGRAGFFVCSRLRFAAFKQAKSNWNGFASWGFYDTIGQYPVAEVVIIPWTDGSSKMVKSHADVDAYSIAASQERSKRVKKPWSSGGDTYPTQPEPGTEEKPKPTKA